MLGRTAATVLVSVLSMQTVPADRSYPSRVTIANAFHRALGAKNPDPDFRNPDYLAARLLGAPERALLAEQVRNAINLDYATAMRTLPPPSPTLVTTHLLRTRHIDNALRESLSSGARQVVILAAGYDSRAYRFHDQLKALPVLEVDRPATQEYKKTRVREALGDLYNSVRWVNIDADNGRLLQNLTRAGYSEHLKTFFVWEGASYYLTESGVRNMLDFVRDHSGPGSEIAFDYMDANHPGINNPEDHHARMGEPLLFGFQNGSASALVQSEGLEVVSDLRYEQLYDRYARRPDGTPAMPHDTGGHSLAGICVARVHADPYVGGANAPKR